MGCGSVFIFTQENFSSILELPNSNSRSVRGAAADAVSNLALLYFLAEFQEIKNSNQCSYSCTECIS